METRDQKAVLAALHRVGRGVAVPMLAFEADMTRGRTEAVVAELEEKGLVGRRVGLVALTLRGRGPAERANG